MESNPDSLIDFYIGRQPIFDSDINLYAYALMFGPDDIEEPIEILSAQQDQASAELILNALGEIGLKNIAGEHKLFIGLSNSLLIQESKPFFSPHNVVIKLFEEYPITPILIRTLKSLRKRGYTIALGRHTFSTKMRALEDYADIVNIDIQKHNVAELETELNRLKAKGLKLLAQKVETYEQVKQCDALGFDYFQGYFFAKPQTIHGQRLPDNKISVLNLLSKIYQPNINLAELSQIITHDVSLSQQLLTFIGQNVPSKYPITSIHHAVLRCGLYHLRNWTGLIALSGMTDKPSELFYLALTRAKFCELVSDLINDPPKETYFSVGLFSVLDALMDRPLDDILEQLGLDDDHMIEALLERTHSPLCLTLKAVKALEQGHLDFERPKDVPLTELTKRYLQAIQYAQKTFQNHQTAN